MKYHMGKHNYYWYLKEIEFKFNYRNEDVFKRMVQVILEILGLAPPEPYGLEPIDEWRNQ